jgi:thymidylate synthase (FAD)
LFSFTQESTRFVNGHKTYPDGLEFIAPTVLGATDELLDSFANSETSYLNLLSLGVRPQEARAVLPNALASTIVVTGNYRAWRHLFVMRTTIETHPDFRAVTTPLLKEFQERVPLLFDDIKPGLSQVESMKLLR